MSYFFLRRSVKEKNNAMILNCLGGEGLESGVLVSPCSVKCFERRTHQVEREKVG